MADEPTIKREDVIRYSEPGEAACRKLCEDFEERIRRLAVKIAVSRSSTNVDDGDYYAIKYDIRRKRSTFFYVITKIGAAFFGLLFGFFTRIYDTWYGFLLCSATPVVTILFIFFGHKD